MAKKYRLLRAPRMNRCIGCYCCMLACARHVYQDYSPQNSNIQIRTRGGLQSKLVANICHGCHEPRCATFCPTGAIQPRPGGGITYNPKDCIACGKCAEGCIIGYITLDANNRPRICKQCGICTQFCPHDCLEMEVTAIVE